ncbi:MAG: ATP-dependent DNA helicase RecG [Phycisphaerae bacterium]|nr:ATP-dependent DNA helicase RecG [Phycisphaerae bacterium]
MAQLELGTEVSSIKGVGPAWARKLTELGIKTVEDLLLHFPFRFDLRKQAQAIASLAGDEASVTVAGEVTALEDNRFGRRPFFQATIRDETGSVLVKWFGGSYLRDKIKQGMQLAVSGKTSIYRKRMQFINPQFQIVYNPEGTNLDRDELMPVYPAGKQLTSRMIGSVIKRILGEVERLIGRWFDAEYLEKRGMMSRPAAVSAMHKPEEKDHWAQGRRRIAYDECLIMQLGVALMRMRQISRPAHALENSELIDQRIRARFPFALTDAQDRAIAEITTDIARDRPMNRLLQGNVGSGKTVVALYAALLAVARGKQAAIMAPTEILATQHYDKVRDYLAGSRVRIALLVGRQKPAERKEILDSLAGGQIDIVVGTHALISEGVKFSDLALVVVDEQHRFGVTQRTTIRGKGFAPHYLVMTATPIPRTLALTVFGDLDVSVIDALPPGRGKTETLCVPHARMPEVFDTVREELDAGRQAYFIYPLVNPSPELELTAAEDAYRELADGPLKDYKIALIHGQMKPADKNAAMAAFRSGDVQALVASVVVEVGMDVPAASVMVITHAERFGLAQLHQLRGRVGRGSDDAVCILVASPKTPDAKQRLKVLVDTNDGFQVAEEDLRIRGPGEIFGTRQHGLPELKVADLIEDFELLRLARRDAFAIVAEDPGLNAPHHQQLRREVIKAYAGKLNLLAGA